MTEETRDAIYFALDHILDEIRSQSRYRDFDESTTSEIIDIIEEYQYKVNNDELA